MTPFDIDYNVLVKILLPRRLRQAKLKAWVNVLVSPVVYIYNLFMLARYDHTYILAHMSQVTKMQGALNDAFDVVRRITIVDGTDYDSGYDYLAAELKPSYDYLISEAHAPQPYLYTNAETVANGYDFIVQIPAAIVYNTAYMKALINKFRLASKNNYQLKAV
ncbi:MAG: hypothetical protein H0X33_14415 [Taibaiella sp.]|nr:hypothetical protein [Taibaiella sp.]